jgi:deoxycytidylate deaminase
MVEAHKLQVIEKTNAISFDPSIGRESSELFIGLSGPVGSGQKSIISAIVKAIKSDFADYSTVIVKLSEFIGLFTDSNENADRYTQLQEAGNKLREKYTNSFLALAAIAKIGMHRTKTQGPKVTRREEVPKKTLWIIDQLKHPAEVEQLRKIYGKNFFLLGVFSPEKQRRKEVESELKKGNYSNNCASLAEAIIQRDKNEQLSYGQKIEKTLVYADFFIRNNGNDLASIEKSVRRFLSLIHGKGIISPTKQEYGMYAAYSAGLRSACLSRQVGAAIVSNDGLLISTGCNDVPKANGGLYDAESQSDHRCYNKGKCFNDDEKSKIEQQILQVISNHLNQNSSKAKELAEAIKNSTRIKDLLEFSRSVHAEMDAIVSVARRGGVAVQGAHLYSTTFPCHNCARHIVAAGIVKVYYIEPYEKSLALDLHSDDIDTEETTGKVAFLHFEGVAPRRYVKFFLPADERKINGKTLDYSDTKRIVDAEFLDSYIEYETKAVSSLSDNEPKLASWFLKDSTNGVF